MNCLLFGLVQLLRNQLHFLLKISQRKASEVSLYFLSFIILNINKQQYHIFNYLLLDIIFTMAIAAQQIRAILWKNFLIGIRTKEFLRQIISVLILGTFLVILESSSSNNFLSPFYLSLAIIGYSRSVGFNWVQEKETFQKEMQNIMGISFFTYYASWLIYFIVNAVYVCLIMLLIVYFGVVRHETFIFVEGYGFANIVLLYFLYALSIIGFVLVFSAFFNKAKIAAQAMIFVQILLNFLYFLRFSDSFTSNRVLIILSSIFPQLAFNFGITTFAFSDSKFPSLDFSYSDSIFMLAVTAVGYFFLSIYLEEVLPNSQGTNKHPLFFIKCLFQSNRQLINQEMPLLAQNQQNSAQYFQPRQGHLNPLIKLNKLSKIFGDKVAVNNVTMSFYANQIFCLLGHNGAGKSTTINLLTGLLKPTDGSLQLLGLNFRQNKDQIRRNMGLCLQFNVLYEDLTIQQHLKFYAILKGMDTQYIQNNIQDIIRECSLINQKGKYVKNLSGGNKRKLSLANALIGKSRIVFLDEPSSGLDPNSRQGIWNIIKSIRTPDRCLILTTHHLQEAQELSQTIGIMSDGKMVIIGSSEYIKEKFNVGYHVVLSFNEQNKHLMAQCRKTVKQTVIGCKEDEQTALNTLKFLLPTSQVSKFGKLFSRLQGLAQLSVKMSNLEDAFIKLGEQVAGDHENLNMDTDLQLPNISCSYFFSRQFKAVFFRKAIRTFRSLGALVSIILPTFFILLGVMMTCLLITGTTPVDQWVKRFLMSFFMVWAFIFNTSSFCGDLVLQREKRFKYLSHVLGLRKLPYWAGNYTFDILIFSLPLSIFFLVVFLLGEQASFLTDVAGYLLLILFLFAFSFIGYSYLFSFMFQKANTAFRLFPFFNMFFFYSIPTIPMNIAPDGVMAQYVTPMISPFVAFSNCFFTEQIMGPYKANFMSKSLVYDCCCLTIQAIVFPTLALYIQHIRFKLRDRKTYQQIQAEQAEEQNPRGSFYDADNISPNDQIFIEHLYKIYNNGYVAIRDNSFSVKKGEIFGLLGPNGAGKSTTFNIVTAALAKTSGTVKILDQHIDNGIMDIFSEFGVCPQYDSIYQNLTTQQHLYYVSRVKGVPEGQIPELLKYYYQLLSLTPYIKVKAGNLSGGNKRKLCVSMAMLANPKIMFFDQPSSGVDPISRRFLWKSLYLSARTKDAAMVLTTHTMNEAESLCSRIGILIKGQFITVGTPAQLKSKYGKGFRISTKFDANQQDLVIKQMRKQFGEGVKIQKLEEAQTTVFTVQNDKFNYSKAYSLLENELLSNGVIKKYQIKESTLEEVFLFLSQLQPEVEPVEYSEPWQFCCWECGNQGCQWIN